MFTLGVVCSVGLGKCIIPLIHHYSIIHCVLTALKSVIFIHPRAMNTASRSKIFHGKGKGREREREKEGGRNGGKGNT